ncbi:polysaccharide deacetylase family protein [Paeniglutamicibacter kerguelensis]|uniref:Peptidoglycan/xylan/chitin deacetylase (PgdA/CDA1 family) n=1 Tax=Paeniglutamicibacter kerguelensis TaxID=254788 RepID=A0ABS4XHZ3_9MICC|nr:polysaccharide deacetylase family protein [Paeniglutamicibacter kerguelensis]MBP2388086.1 peptidoglycan/xylan/chitin deacetylase (PgdA/CDA1 family) [Paeniglutamicibacter kerguelensis]
MSVLHPRSRRRVFTYRIAGLALVAALMSGCAPVVAPSTLASEPTPTSAPASEPKRFSPRQGLSLELVPGIHTLARTDEVNRIFAQWLAVPGHPEVESAQRATVDETIASFLGALEEKSTGAASAHELSIDPELTGSSRTMLGIRSSISAVVGDNTSKGYWTQWFDLGAGRMLETKELFVDAAALQKFVDLVGYGLRGRPGIGEGAAAPVDPQQPASLNFDAAGDALVEFGENTVAASTEGNVVIKLSGTVITPLLSAPGQQVRDAGMRPTGMPAPKPSSTSSASGSNSGTKDPVDGTHDVDGRDVDCRKVKCVALTFDDGPGPKTEQLLDALKQENAAATFFVVGPNAEARPQVLARMVAEGHEIGNHTWNHRVLTSLAPGRVAMEISGVADAVEDATGTAPTLLRPPYGATNATVKKAAGVPVILWDVDTLDWKVRDASKVVSNALRDTRPGSIVLMHDIHFSTIEAVPAILKGLRAKGYHFVTVSELLASANPQDGAVYGRGPAPGKAKSKR